MIDGYAKGVNCSLARVIGHRAVHAKSRSATRRMRKLVVLALLRGSVHEFSSPYANTERS